MSIVTKTGDSGTTGLFGGKRVAKDSPRIVATGAVDELNAIIGLALCEQSMNWTIRDQLQQLQHLLFRLGADLATPIDAKAKQERMNDDHIGMIEQWISGLEKALPRQTAFLLPGGSKLASLLHVTRTVCRRAERCVVTLEKTEAINASVRIFLNRLSDYLFLAARKANAEKKMKETEVEY